MSDEALAASYLLNKNDPTLLTYKEIKDSYGSCCNFFYSMGLKPYNPEDCEEAVQISRAFKRDMVRDTRQETTTAQQPTRSGQNTRRG
jgi:hypothetical protein